MAAPGQLLCIQRPTIAELGALDSLNEQLQLNRVCISGVLIILRILSTIRSKGDEMRDPRHGEASEDRLHYEWLLGGVVVVMLLRVVE